MTDNAQRLTDDVVRRALSELAAGPDADVLVSDVLRTVDAQAQVGRRPWDTRGWGRAAVLVAAAALLVTAVIGATVTLTRPQPTPQPVRTPLPLTNELVRVPDFFVPFSYRVPEGMSGKLMTTYNPDSVYAIRPKAGSGTFVLFSITGQMHAFPVAGATRECRSLGSEPATDDDVATFLRGLDEGPIQQTTLGGQPASEVVIDPAGSACRNAVFHVHGLLASQLEPGLPLAYPGRLIVSRTADATVGLLIYAPTAAALADWLPVAGALTNGLTFDAAALSGEVRTASDFVVPFTYRLPVGANGQLEGHGSENRVYLLDARAGGSGTLELFPIGGYVHGCGTSSGNGVPTSSISSEPSTYLEALGGDVGVGMGAVSETTLGGLPAYAADIDPTLGRCDRASIHIDGMGLSFMQYEPALNRPGRLIVSRAHGSTFGVFISAPSKDLLADWLPIAQAYLDGLQFQTGR
jgi:hypothetical protein